MTAGFEQFALALASTALLAWTAQADTPRVGVTSAVNHERGDWRLNAGVNANTYARAHRGYLRPATTLYDNTGHKRDVSAFVKLSRDVGRARWFGLVDRCRMLGGGLLRRGRGGGRGLRPLRRGGARRRGGLPRGAGRAGLARLGH